MDEEKLNEKINKISKEIKELKPKLVQVKSKFKKLSEACNKNKEKVLRLKNTLSNNKEEIKFYTCHYNQCNKDLNDVKQRLSKAQLANMSFAGLRQEMRENVNKSTKNNESNASAEENNELPDSEVHKEIQRLEQEIVKNYQQFKELVTDLNM